MKDTLPQRHLDTPSNQLDAMIAYFLSLATGLIGTSLFVTSETHEEQQTLAQRSLYSSTLVKGAGFGA